MNVWVNFKSYLNSELVLYDTLTLALCTIFIGFAPNSISLGLFVFLSFRWGVLKKNKPRIGFSLVLPIILYLLFLASLLWSKDIEITIKGLLRTMPLLLIPISFSLIPKLKEEGFFRILKAFTSINFLFSLFFIIVACFEYLKEKNLDVFFYHELVSIFDLHAIYVSLIFLISFLFILSKKDKTKFDFVKLITFFLLIFLLSSKAIIILLVFAILSYILVIGLRFENKGNFFKGLLIFSVISIITSSTFLERASIEKKTKLEEIFTKKSFGLAYNWTGTSIRLFQLRLLKEQIEEGDIGLVGYGLFASRTPLKKGHEKYNTYPGYHNYNYHNQYAQILAELGFIGFFLFILMLAISIWEGLVQQNYFTSMVFISFAISFFTETFLWRQTGLFLFIIFFSMLLCKDSLKNIR